MRNKPGIDNLDIDDLYNNLKVYEADIKGSSGSSSNSQNEGFVFAESTSSTNELNAAYSVSTATGYSSQAQSSSSYADELMFSVFSTQSNTSQLDNEDLEKIIQDDLEEMDLKWQSNISLIMRNKPGIDNLDIDDLYNNLKVYEADIKGSSGSSSNSQNEGFVFAESTSSTNELNAAYSVSTATGYSSQAQSSSSYADELMFSVFSTQSNTSQLDNEDLEKIIQDDLEEMDLKWQRLYNKTGRKLEFNGKEPIGFDKTKVEC
nr:hypothetical protein [Tanacetum cinerariifolium]